MVKSASKGRSSSSRGKLLFLLVPLGMYALFICWDSYRRSAHMLLDSSSEKRRMLSPVACKPVFVESSSTKEQNNAHIFLLDGNPIDGAPAAKGINVVIIDPWKQTVVKTKSYDKGKANQELASDLGKLTPGLVILIAVKNLSKKIDASVFKALKAVGSSLSKGQTPKGYVLIGSVGGTVLAESNGDAAQAFALLPCTVEQSVLQEASAKHQHIIQQRAKEKDEQPPDTAREEEEGQADGAAKGSEKSAAQPSEPLLPAELPTNEDSPLPESEKDRKTKDLQDLEKQESDFEDKEDEITKEDTEEEKKAEESDKEAKEKAVPSEPMSGSPETTFRCVGGHGDRNCLFKNLYFHRGRFAMFVLKGPNKPIEVLRANKYDGLWKPDIEIFNSVERIESHLKSKAVIEERGLSVQFNPLFHNNFGHGIFDGLYPAFFATVKLKVQDRPWRPVVAVDPGCFIEGASGSLNPGDLVEAYLPHPKYERTLRAERVRIVSAEKKQEKSPECKWKSGMDHNGLDLGSDHAGSQPACMQSCALSFGCRAAVLYEGICYLKGDNGNPYHRGDRPGIRVCLMSGEKPKANIVVRRDAEGDDAEKHNIPEAWVVGKVRRRCMTEEIYQKFGGTGEIRRLFELERDCRNNPELLIRFEEVVIGVGGAGNMIADKTGAIGGSLPPHNTMRQFRDRMLKMYGLPTESGVKPVPPDRPLNVIIISNKRFNVRGEDRRALNQVIDKLNHKGGWRAEMIDWGQIGHGDNKFKEHLKKTQKADVYVSSIGTALQNVPFMKDGKIYIALGSVWMRSGQYFPTFMEQQLAGGGTPYLRTLYADPGGVLRSGERYPHLGEDGYFAGVNGTLVSELMKQAEGLLRKGFEIPVAAEENLSVEGRIIVEICKRDEKACSNIMQHRNGGHGMALLWNECVVYEVGPWRKGGLCGSAHHKLLRQLRKEFGIPGYGAPEK